jgi:NTP pyrophosphatase (non-canonical NTP hydrolase)
MNINQLQAEISVYKKRLSIQEQMIDWCLSAIEKECVKDLRTEQRMEMLERYVVEWAKDRDIFAMSTPEKQCAKTIEEACELSDAIKQCASHEDVCLELGDVGVTLCIQAAMQGTTLYECIRMAYAKIKNRTGCIKDGVFVKDGQTV